MRAQPRKKPVQAMRRLGHLRAQPPKTLLQALQRFGHLRAQPDMEELHELLAEGGLVLASRREQLWLPLVRPFKTWLRQGLLERILRYKTWLLQGLFERILRYTNSCISIKVACDTCVTNKQHTHTHTHTQCMHSVGGINI